MQKTFQIDMSLNQQVLAFFTTFTDTKIVTVKALKYRIFAGSQAWCNACRYCSYLPIVYRKIISNQINTLELHDITYLGGN